MNTTRRAFLSQAAAAPIAMTMAIPAPAIAEIAPDALVALGNDLIAACNQHSETVEMANEADGKMKQWEKANPCPRLPDGIDDEDERWPAVLKAYEAGLRERGGRRIAAMFEYRLAKTKQATFITKKALSDAAYAVAEFDADTLPALMHKAELSAWHDCESIIARSIIADLLMMQKGGDL